MSVGRKLLEWSLRKLEVEPIAFWRLGDFPLAAHLQRLFEFKGVDCVVDVGAFDGHFGRFLRQEVKFGGVIISFEPQPDMYKKLEESAENDPNWIVFNYALGEAPGYVNMNVMVGAPLTSIRRPYSKLPSNIAHRNVVTHELNVELKRLDSVFPKLSADMNVQTPFLKMDTQGYDIEVFRGASGCLADFVAMQSEVSVIPLYENTPSWIEALDAYKRAGFELSGLFPVSFDEQMRVIEFDAVLIRA